MTAEERLALKGMLPPVMAAGGALAVALGGGVVAFILAVFLGALVSSQLPAAWKAGALFYIPVWIAGGAALVMAAAVWRRTRADAARREAAWAEYRASIQADLDAGMVETRVFHATEAVRVEEAEDEGSQYLVRLADGRAVFRVGQDLYGCEEERRFPCTRFEIARAPRAEEVLGMRCVGDYLAPSSTRPAFTDEEHDAELVPDDGEVIDGERYERLVRGS